MTISKTKVYVENGQFFTWGNGGDGQLGIGTLSNHFSPQLVNFLDPLTGEDLSVIGIDVDCGAQHTAVVTGNISQFIVVIQCRYNV